MNFEWRSKLFVKWTAFWAKSDALWAWWLFRGISCRKMINTWLHTLSQHLEKQSGSQSRLVLCIGEEPWVGARLHVSTAGEASGMNLAHIPSTLLIFDIFWLQWMGEESQRMSGVPQLDHKFSLFSLNFLSMKCGIHRSWQVKLHMSHLKLKLAELCQSYARASPRNPTRFSCTGRAALDAGLFVSAGNMARTCWRRWDVNGMGRHEMRSERKGNQPFKLHSEEEWIRYTKDVWWCRLFCYITFSMVFDLRKVPSPIQTQGQLHCVAFPQPSGANGSRSWLGLFPKSWLVVRVFGRCLAQDPCGLDDFHWDRISVFCDLSGLEIRHIQC